jgi:hypothetical protein
VLDTKYLSIIQRCREAIDMLMPSQCANVMRLLAATARLDEFVGPKDRAVPLNGVHYTA